MKNTVILGLLAVLLTGVTLQTTGCASGQLTATSSAGNSANAGVRLTRPSHIYVAPIDVSQGT